MGARRAPYTSSTTRGHASNTPQHAPVSLYGGNLCGSDASLSAWGHATFKRQAHEQTWFLTDRYIPETTFRKHRLFDRQACLISLGDHSPLVGSVRAVCVARGRESESGQGACVWNKATQTKQAPPRLLPWRHDRQYRSHGIYMNSRRPLGEAKKGDDKPKTLSLYEPGSLHVTRGIEWTTAEGLAEGSDRARRRGGRVSSWINRLSSRFTFLGSNRGGRGLVRRHSLLTGFSRQSSRPLHHGKQALHF